MDLGGLMRAAHLKLARIEWLTVMLIAAVYAVLALLVWFHAVLPWWAILPIGSYAAALHSSLQHEVLHGHPTRSRGINEMLISLSPTFWLPYGCYRDLHLQHHNDTHLTDPDQDPESYYLLPDDWAAMGPIRRTLFAINQTLGGRMLIGPAVGMCRLWGSEWRAILHGDTKRLHCWISYFVSAFIVITLVTVVCGMPFWEYYLLIAYPGISMALIRSYCEHQAVEDLGERTIIVEASAFWSLLFLNNNLHVAHHTRPAMAWYQLPAYYKAQRDILIRQNGGYMMRGYGAIFRRYFLSPKEPVAHPGLGWLKR
jgi:fatty acid desaturase